VDLIIRHDMLEHVLSGGLHDPPVGGFFFAERLAESLVASVADPSSSLHRSLQPVPSLASQSDTAIGRRRSNSDPHVRYSITMSPSPALLAYRISQRVHGDAPPDEDADQLLLDCLDVNDFEDYGVDALEQE
jgi:hypothetical protein